MVFDLDPRPRGFSCRQPDNWIYSNFLLHLPPIFTATSPTRAAGSAPMWGKCTHKTSACYAWPSQRGQERGAPFLIHLLYSKPHPIHTGLPQIKLDANRQFREQMAHQTIECGLRCLRWKSKQSRASKCTSMCRTVKNTKENLQPQTKPTGIIWPRAIPSFILLTVALVMNDWNHLLDEV